MEKWLTTKKVSALLRITERAVRKKIASGDYQYREDDCKAGGTQGKRYLIALSSLPADAQHEYYQETAQTKQERPAETKPDAAKTNQPVINLAVLEEIGGDKALDELITRANLVKQAKEIQAQRGNVVEQLDELCRANGIKLPTLYNWLDAYDKEGEVGLLRKPVRKKMEEAEANGPKFGTRGFGSAALDYMTALYLSPTKPKVRYVYEQTVREAEKRIAAAQNEMETQYLQELWQVGSYQTACRYISELPNNVLAYGREGYEIYRNKFMPKTLMDYSKVRVNQYFIGDHHQLDVFVEYEGKAIRPWLSTWEDAKSRVMVGWCLSPQNNSQTIGLALRHAALRKPNSPICGLPVRVYIDNGKDYQGKHMAGGLKHSYKFDYSKEVKGVFASLGIEPDYCTARTPWAKGMMERFYQTFEVQFSMQLPGYCGSNNKARPEGFDEKKLLAQGKLVKLDELAKLIEEYFDKYHNTVHSELKDTPLNVYMQNEKAREGVPDARAFDILLMRAKKRKVYTVGVRFEGRYYTHPALDNYVGEDVIVRYDPGHLDEIMIFQGTSYLCTARQNYTEFGNQDELQLHMQRQKRSQRLVKDAVNGYKERAGLKKGHYTGSTVEDGKADMITGFERAAKEIEADQQERSEPPIAPERTSIREQWLERQGKKALGLG
ncbi:Mu transposase C-terminal domain-containing protein [Paenibacillus naphthalenovorans]|uniref:Mu transposase C-terminal domain-containing protein n=1 Tax=Paenibacillus naphthalenovorans TaxID=162209 RepID=UPI000891E46B|nr:Mu transposase C-terminal domain-containing protein [Paenibacillus naphthalenovorans]SDI50092.1 putative transposase [Paenibacillus naphthalenovorans]